jgi:fimbrial chaperone protein
LNWQAPRNRSRSFPSPDMRRLLSADQIRLFALARACASILLIASPLLAAPQARASAAMQISPILIDLQAPAASGTLNVANQAPQPASVQVRVFRWTQAEGAETLTPTQDVVASPPFATIPSGSTLAIRVIRASTAPVVGEEAYRVVIDQLPESNRNGQVVVNMLLRQVLPAFFGAPDKTPSDVNWSLRRMPKGLALVARNAGDRRMRIGNDVLTFPGRRPIRLGGGLLGYVLGRSEMSWTIPHGESLGTTATLRAESDTGAVVAKALVSGR